ncbi:uncharacterized protein [Periplaneta americana]|uniref:uncharacterized protein n=1 Tax=Periplaneta americana TaxID=6978 RepID=UPI0037E801AC
MKATLVIILFASFHLSSQIDVDQLQLMRSLVGMGWNVVSGCMEETNLSFMKCVTSMVTSRTLPKEAKCTLACVLENFGMMSDNKPDKEMLTSIIGMIPIETVSKPLIEMVGKCVDKVTGTDKCQNCVDTMRCCATNAISTVFSMRKG